jgi:hypothetical protein
MSKKNLTVSALSLNESETESSTMPQYSAISEHSLVKGTPNDIAEWLMQLRPDSHASRSVSPESAKGGATRGICGLKQGNVFASYDLKSRSWKTSQGCLLTNTYSEFSETWPKSGMMQDGVCSVLMMSERHTEGNGHGLWPTMRSNLTGNITPHRCNDKFNNLESVLARQMWPTPQAENFRGRGGNRKDEMGLDRMVKMWPTPKSSPSGPDFALMNRPGTGTDDLVTAVARSTWPTPAATDGQRSGKMTENMTGQSLTQMVNSFPTPKSRDWKGKTQRGTHAPMDGLCNTLDVTGGQLNPTWVEWLMGWPLGWTDLRPLEMDKFREWLLVHGEY